MMEPWNVGMLGMKKAEPMILLFQHSNIPTVSEVN